MGRSPLPFSSASSPFPDEKNLLPFFGRQKKYRSETTLLHRRSHEKRSDFLHQGTPFFFSRSFPILFLSELFLRFEAALFQAEVPKAPPFSSSLPTRKRWEKVLCARTFPFQPMREWDRTLENKGFKTFLLLLPLFLRRPSLKQGYVLLGEEAHDCNFMIFQIHLECKLF